MIEDFASLIPDSLLERSGKGFYSGRTAFENTSKLYVLGLNPGGSLCPTSRCPDLADV